MFRQHDVDGSKVKLDYNALLTTTRIAFGAALQKVRSEVGAMDNIALKRPLYLVGMRMAAEHIERAAVDLAQIAETLAALEYGLRRPQVEIINREFEED